MVSYSADLEDTDESQSLHSANTTMMDTTADNPDGLQALSPGQENHQPEQQQPTVVQQAIATLSPEIQAVITALLLNQKPKHKLKDPDPFNGKDISLFPQFEGKLKAKLNVDGAAIGSEKEQVWYAFNLLKDDAAARIYPWMEAFENTTQFTKEGFLKHLRFAFKDHAIRDKAIAKLNTLHQGNRAFYELLTEFDRLLLEAGGHGWDDTVKKGYLRAAINNDLREKLITMDEAESYIDYCGQIKRVADRMEEHRRIARARSLNGNRSQVQKNQQYVSMPAKAHSPPALAIQPDPMDWEPTPARTNNVQTRRARWVSEEEREKRKKDGRCLRCGASGHMIARCPYRPAARPAQIAAVAAHEPELEDDQGTPTLVANKDESEKGQLL